MSENELRVEVEAVRAAAEAAVRAMEQDLDDRLPDNFRDFEDADDFILYHDPIDYRWDRW